MNSPRAVFRHISVALESIVLHGEAHVIAPAISLLTISRVNRQLTWNWQLLFSFFRLARTKDHVAAQLRDSDTQTVRQSTCEWMCLSLMCAASCVVDCCWSPLLVLFLQARWTLWMNNVWMKIACTCLWAIKCCTLFGEWREKTEDASG